MSRNELKQHLFSASNRGTAPADTLAMFITEPILTELWIVAFCCAVNGTDAFPLHADVVDELRKHKPVARA